MWQTAGVNQTPVGGSDYPFVRRPPAVVRYLLADWYLSLEDDGCALAQPPLRVAALYGFGTQAASPPGGGLPAAAVHARDVVVVDADGNIAFDSTEAATYLESAWGSQMHTATWVGAAGTLRLTHRTALPPWADGAPYDASAIPAIINLTGEPSAAELDGRAYERLPRRLRSVRVGLTKLPAGALVLQGGYNCRLAAEALTRVEGGRRRSQISIRFRAGDGLGRLDGCADADLAIRRINGVAPATGGDFTLDDGGGCYRVQRPVSLITANPRRASLTSAYGGGTAQAGASARLTADGYSTGHAHAAVAAATLQLFNDCGPCCECDDYVQTYEGVRRLWRRYQDLGTRARAAADQHAANVERWERQRKCRHFQTLRLVARAESDFAVLIAGLHCNTSQCCLQPLYLRVTLETLRTNVAIDLSSAFAVKCQESWRAGTDTDYAEARYTPQLDYPVIDSVFDRAEPQSSSRFRLRFKFAGGLPAEGDAVRITLSVHAEDHGAYGTGQPCDLPPADQVVVPAAVAAVWATHPVPAPVRGLIQKTIAISGRAGCGVCA